MRQENKDVRKICFTILLMVQKSRDHQLRLVVGAYPINNYRVLHIPGGAGGRPPSINPPQTLDEILPDVVAK